MNIFFLSKQHNKKWIFIVDTNYGEQLFSMNSVILPTIPEQAVN